MLVEVDIREIELSSILLRVCINWVCLSENTFCKTSEVVFSREKPGLGHDKT